MTLDFKKDDIDILIYAFRYALGRRTYAVGTVVDIIMDNWGELPANTIELIVREIREHLAIYGNLGMECDKAQWFRIIDKYDSTLY